MTEQQQSLLKTFVNKYLGGVADLIGSVLDTIVFIEFIYEEALQTALFAANQAYRNKDYETAQAIVDYILTEIYPAARSFLDTWGDIAPYSKGCFSRFYEAARMSAETLNNAIPTMGQPEGVVRIYANEPDVKVYIDNEFVGVTDETEGILVKLAPGYHTIEGKKEGYETAVKNVKVEPKKYIAVKLYLTKAEE